MLVKDNTAEYYVSQEKKKLSRLHYRHDKPVRGLLNTSQESSE